MTVNMHLRDGSSNPLKGSSQMGKAFVHTSTEVDRILTPDIIAYHDPALEQCFGAKCTAKCEVGVNISGENRRLLSNCLI